MSDNALPKIRRSISSVRQGVSVATTLPSNPTKALTDGVLFFGSNSQRKALGQLQRGVSELRGIGDQVNATLSHLGLPRIDWENKGLKNLKPYNSGSERSATDEDIGGRAGEIRNSLLREGWPKTINSSGRGVGLHGIYTRPDPIMQYDFRCRIQGMDRSDLYVEGVEMPNETLSNDPIYQNARNVYVAGTVDMDNATLTFYEDINMTATRFLESWYDLIVTHDGYYNTPDKYKRQILIDIMAPGSAGTKRDDNRGSTRPVTPSSLTNKTITVNDEHGYDYKPICTVMLYGAFPTSRSPFTWQSTTSERQVVTQQFSIDGVEYYINDEPLSKSVADQIKSTGRISQGSVGTTIGGGG